MRQPLRIVHIFGNAYAGNWAFYPLKIWHEAGHQVAAIFPTEGELVERLRQEKVPVSVIPYPRRLRHVGDAWHCITQIQAELRAFSADVVHCHLVPANLWGRIAAWLAHVPVRVTQWPGPLPLELPVPRLLELATVWMDSAIIASSLATQRIYQRYPHTRHKVHLIYYGFPLEPFTSGPPSRAIRTEFAIPQDASVVGMVAYMYPPLRERKLRGIGIKGHEILIQAASKVLAVRDDVRFLIAGDELIPGTAQTYKPRLIQMANDLGLSDRVIFAGRRNDIPQFLSEIDIAVVPSMSENVGGAVEPLLMGKPVVASNVGGLPDVVIEGKTGMLVPPGEPDALAQSLLRMLSLPVEERQRMGEVGRQIVAELFDIRETVKQQEALYYYLLGS